ncbi:MAG: UvrD-helicase domain-containing protein, partial [Lachnospiraceae bacterium]|nr:UvrD-helicase domain-containing protein [Lachnospiraceae bacterium]
MEFTAQQKKVIEKRNSDILVSAAAGSGKTAVLVERIIERICDDKDSVDIDRILVCTFTRAAAREMRERIFAALNKRAKEHPDDHRIQMQ